MTISTAAELRANMPVGVAGGITAQDMQDFIDSTEEFTTQAVISTSANYTVTTADNRRLILVNAGGARTVTLSSNLPVGFECAIFQESTGQATVTVTGGVLRHPDSHTKTSKQYAVVYCKVFRNAGSAPNVVFTGDTAL